MLLKLEEPLLLSKAIELISELVTEVRLKVGEFGISINAIDPANVAMVSFKIPKSAFAQFEADEEVLGVNLEDLKRILKRAGSGSSIVLESKDGVLDIQILDKVKRSFSLGLLQIEGEEKEFPDLDFVATVEMDSVDFISSIEDCLVVADACSFVIEEGKFIIEAKGLNSARSEFSGDEAKISSENCKSRYSLEYLSKFLKGAKLCDKISLKFASDHPMRLDLKPGSTEISFILAPRVETED
jgi:proliferating cell nuclear antigen